MSTHTTDSTNANRTRWGGILTLVAVVLIAARVTLDIALAPTGLDADNAKAAAFITANSGVYNTVSWLGIAGALCAAMAAFFLVTRATSTTHGFPASAFWLLVGIGQLAALGLYVFRASGFMTLASHQAALPVAFEAARNTLNLVGPVATIAIYSGFIVIFTGEARSRTSAAPAWLSSAIVLCSLVALVGGITRLFPGGAPVGMMLGYAFFPVALGLLLWSIKVGFPNLRLAWDNKSVRHGEEA